MTKYGMKLNSHKLVAIIILFQLTVLIGLLEVVSQGYHGTGNLDVHFPDRKKQDIYLKLPFGFCSKFSVRGYPSMG